MIQDSLTSGLQESAGNLGDIVPTWQVVVAVVVFAISIVVIVQGVMKRRADRRMHAKVMRRLDEESKRDWSEDA